MEAIGRAEAAYVAALDAAARTVIAARRPDIAARVVGCPATSGGR